MALTPQELKEGVQGLLSFPVTPFKAGPGGPAAELDLETYRSHLEFMLAHKPAALFACGGTGEFFNLTLDEYRRALGVAVETLRGRVPVIGAAGYGTQTAIQYVKAAEEAGADGVLVLPPYLITPEPEGLLAHYTAVAQSTHLGLIVYQRDNALFSAPLLARLAEAAPNVVGFKDGLGDMERLARIRAQLGDRLTYLNGLPTAEISARAFFGQGVRNYSSAVFNFIPEVSNRFYQAMTSGDERTVDEILQRVIIPLCALRDRRRGYAVSFIKAGTRVIGRPTGPVRPPLVDLTEAEHEELRSILRNAGVAEA